MANPAGLAGVRFLTSHAVHEDSLTSVDLASRRWKDFCRQSNIHFFGEPTGKVSPVHIAGFVSFLFGIKTVRAWSTYRGMLSGLKFYLSINNVDVSAFNSYLVQKTKQGLRKAIGKFDLGPPVKETGSCTFELLMKILPFFSNDSIAARNARRVAIICLAGVNRLGELIATRHNSGICLLRKHITVISVSLYRVFLRFSKNDTWHEGKEFDLQANGTVLCPIRAINECMIECHSGRRRGSHTFFVGDSDEPLTDKQVMHHLHGALRRANIDPSPFTTKTFRRGGATSLAEFGADRAVIMAAGRWKSKCYKIYIDKSLVGQYL